MRIFCLQGGFSQSKTSVFPRENVIATARPICFRLIAYVEDGPLDGDENREVCRHIVIDILWLLYHPLVG